MKKYFIASLIVFSAVLLPQIAEAHADGKSLEAEDEAGNSIDIGYSELPVAGESVTFGFSARDAEKNAISFDQIWVRISKDSATYVATGLAKAPIGKTVLTYRFPETGSYAIEVRFERAGESVAEHTFILTASASEDQASSAGISFNVLLSIAAGFLLGSLLTYYFYLRSR